jgi:hypothetical protein
MQRLRYWLGAWIFCGALTLSGFGQALPDWRAKNGVNKPPDFGILDEGGFFSRNSGAMKRISDQLRKLEIDHAFRICLMVEPVLIGTTAPELAAQLQQSWLPEGNGLVVVFESDNRSLGFGLDPGVAPDGKKGTGQVPTHETTAILVRVKAATEMNLAPEAYIEALMGNLAREFTVYLEKRAAPLPAGRSLHRALLTVGALALLALAAIVVGALVRLPSIAGTRSFRFPVVDRPERLGAPCGGGDVTTRRFRPVARS